jgi:hypothetical protein
MSAFESKNHHTYFIYGANLNPELLFRRCGTPKPVGVARLADYRLGFFGHSAVWDGGEEAAVPQAGEEVWGMLYRLSFPEADLLDEWQGVRPDGCGPYYLFPVFATDLEGCSHAALMYRKDVCGVSGLPSDAQLNYIVDGAQAQGLPSLYIERLKGMPSKKAAYPVPRADSRWRSLLASVCRACG